MIASALAKEKRRGEKEEEEKGEEERIIFPAGPSGKLTRGKTRNEQSIS